VNNVTATLSNEAMNKIKVVYLDEFNNFCVHDFSAEIICCFKILFEVVTFRNLKFELIKQSHMTKIIAIRT
jgi:hypothetical protein